MTELDARLASLSPEKRALLARKLAERASAADRIGSRGNTGAAPLSFAQEMLWIFEQMTPGTVTYSIPVSRRVVGALDVARLERALSVVVQRHEALRTSFVEVDGLAQQVPQPAREIHAELIDVGDVANETREAAAQSALRIAAGKPFDLSEGSHPRLIVVRLSESESLISLVFHHIAFDGGSIGVVMRELSHAYAAGGESLQPVSLQLADYAVWERHSLTDERLAADLAFWKHYLDGAPASIELPTDAARTGVTGPGERHITHFSAATSAAVHTLAERHGATSFMVLLAAYQSVLHRYSGQADLVVGVPVAGRDRPEMQGIVGYVANMLAMRARFDDVPNFSALVARTREQVIAAIAHQAIPYERVLREVRAGRPAAEQSLFSYTLTMQDARDSVRSFGNVRLEPLAIDMGTAKFDIALSLTELPEGIRASFEYRSDLFAAESIARFGVHLENFLLAAATAPEAPVDQIAFLANDERTRMLVDWNDTDAEWPRDATLVSLFETQVRRRPTAVAVECGDVAWTYQQLDERANRLAWALRTRGVGPDVLVGVCLEKSADVIAALLGVLKAGGAYVPIDPAYPDDRIQFMLEDSETPVIITDDALAPRLEQLGASTLIASTEWNRAEAATAEAPAPTATPANLCYVIYTSGSTGRPKGVLIEHRNVVRLLFNSRFQFDFSENDVWTVFHSFSFDFSVWEMYGALLYGGRVIVVPKSVAQQPAEYLDLLAAKRVTVLNQVPSAFYALMEEALGRKSLDLSLRYVIFGGEALQPALLREWKTRFPSTTLVNMFGITETTVHVTFKVIGDAEIANGASNIGRPIPTLTTYVLDPNLQLLPIGVTGEVCVGGAGVARGYLKRPDLTAERFVAHPFRAGERLYRSGDLGRQRSDGEIEYLGRRDAQVKIRGFRIELGEIEAALAQHAAVSACVVHVVQAGTSGPRLAAYVVTRDAVTRAELRAWMFAHVPEHMVPSAFMELPSLPLTGNGKVNRAALPPISMSGDDATAVVAPRNDIEAVIAKVWADLLGTPNIDVETSFLELGGHSLLAVRVVAQLAKIFRTTLSLRRFFETPTVAGLAHALVATEPKPGQTATIAALLRKVQSMTPEERERLRQDGSAGSRTERGS